MKSFPSMLVAAALISVPAAAAEIAIAVQTPAASAPAAVQAGVPGKISANVLNARLNADLKAPAAKKLRKGDAIVITGVKGNWYEISVPQGTALYASGVFLRDGKALEKTALRIKADGRAPVAATLAKGETVKVLGDAGYGWVKVEAPATLKLYVAKFYVDTDDAAVAKLAAAPKAEAAKPAAPAEKVQEVKADAPKADAPAAPAVKPEAKAEEAVAPAAAEAAPKKPAKPAIPQQDPVKVREMQNQALRELGVNPDEAAEVKSFSGKLRRVEESTNFASNFALLLHGGEDFVFVCIIPEAAEMWLDREVTIRGAVFQPAGWKHAVLRAEDLRPVL